MQQKLIKLFKKLKIKCSRKSLKSWTNSKYRRKIANYLCNTLFGFIGGLFLTYILFMFLVFQLHLSLSKATWIASLLGIILTLGLSFSMQLRCLVLLILPQFFSKKGRVAIIGYAFVMAFSGPAANTVKNTEVLSSSLSCGQEQLSDAMKGVVEIMKQPFMAIKNAVKHIIKVLERTLTKVKLILLDIKDLSSKVCKSSIFFPNLKMMECRIYLPKSYFHYK